jgi:hypothetical protein
MRRTTVPNLATAAFFFALALLFAWSVYQRIAGTPDCTASAASCSLGELWRLTVYAPIDAGLAIGLLALALRVIWGMRRGE